MATQQMSPPMHQMPEDIAALDFSMVKIKLMDSEEGEGWSPNQCERIELEYRRYLTLSQKYPDRALVPSKLIDTFWHYHILDTRAYAKDCDLVFGRFLHHFPYFGMRDEQDAHDLHTAYDETLALYEMVFGPLAEDIWAREGASRCPNCGRR